MNGSIKKLVILVAAAIGFSFVSAAPAAAQATRTWVSGVGDDVNPCSRTAPCKTFAGAISKTAAGGEINAIDSGGFGAVTITKSITIDGNAVHAGVLAANSNGITVNGAGIVVTLRNLSINGANTTIGNGIRVLQAGAVTIENVVIQNFGGIGTNGRGISIETATANVRVSVKNSTLYNINNHGIHSFPTAGNVILTVDDTKIDRSAAGSAIQLRQLTTAVINNSSMTNQAVGGGVVAELTSVVAHVSNSLMANNVHGVFNGNDGGTPTTRLYHNVITNNTGNGLTINGGSVISYGNNAIRGNSGNEAPTGVAIGTQ